MGSACHVQAYRCDYCNGTFEMQSSELNPAPGRTMSSTADGVHFMHHRGLIKMKGMLVPCWPYADPMLAQYIC